MNFREIEYKFLVDEAFDSRELQKRVTALGPRRTMIGEVRDVYYLLDGRPDHIYRHRYDERLQQLTVKSLTGDSFDRLEVNLDLGHHLGDQAGHVEAFLASFGILWRETVKKQIEVYYFDDCEIVYYLAQSNGHELRCVEFEAVGAEDPESARALLDDYVKLTGFDLAARETKSLVQLLFPDRF